MYTPSFAYRRPIFQHAMRIISSITNSNPAIVTTTFAHQYIDGLLIRINIPVGFGMEQMNQQFGPITVTGPTTFTLPINSTFFDLFVLPAGNGPFQDAQCIPIGEINSILQGATKNVLPYPAN